MAHPIDRRKTNISEDALEAAYWKFDSYQKSRVNGLSERDNFKAAIREHFPHWFSWLNDES